MKIKLALSICSLFFFLSIVLLSCRKENISKTEPLQQAPNLPSEPFGYAEKHLVNNNLATLGRVLFYDKNMSVNNAVACGSCHKQQFAFADNVRFNKGFNGVDLKRNSPSIQGIRGFRQDFQNFNNGSQNLWAAVHLIKYRQVATRRQCCYSGTEDNQALQTWF